MVATYVAWHESLPTAGYDVRAEGWMAGQAEEVAGSRKEHKKLESNLSEKTDKFDSWSVRLGHDTPSSGSSSCREDPIPILAPPPKKNLYSIWRRFAHQGEFPSRPSESEVPRDGNPCIRTSEFWAPRPT